MPKPSYVIFSGTGLQLVYLVNPIDYLNERAFRLWKKLQDYLIQTLRDVGADSACNDLARVFRLAGTFNSKTGRQVYLVQYLTAPYSMEMLAAGWLPPPPPPSQAATISPTDFKAKEALPAKETRRPAEDGFYSVYASPGPRQGSGETGTASSGRDGRLQGIYVVSVSLSHAFPHSQSPNGSPEHPSAQRMVLPSPVPLRSGTSDTKRRRNVGASNGAKRPLDYPQKSRCIPNRWLLSQQSNHHQAPQHYARRTTRTCDDHRKRGEKSPGTGKERTPEKGGPKADLRHDQTEGRGKNPKDSPASGEKPGLVHTRAEPDDRFL